MKKKNSKTHGTLQTQAKPRPAAAVGGSNRRSKDKPEPFTADELRRISAEISAMDQPPVRATRLELMEIDPWNVHAYWHIGADDVTAGQAALRAEGAGLVLRFTDTSPRTDDEPSPHPGFDIEVPDGSSSRYVNLWRDAKRYSAEIGLRGADGGFVALARSNEIATPRGGQSPDLNFRRAEVRSPTKFEPAASGPGLLPSDQLLRDLFPQRAPLSDEFPLVDAEPYQPSPVEPPFPALAAAQDEAVERNPAPSELREEPIQTPAASQEYGEEPFDGPGFPLIEAEEIQSYRAPARRMKQDILAATQAPVLPAPAPEAVGMADFDFEPRPLPIPEAPSEPSVVAVPAPAISEAGPVVSESSFPAAVPGPTEAAPPPPVALEAVLGRTVFSTAAAGPEIDVSASVVVEGHYPAGTALTLFGEPVPLDQDGRFKLRLPLEQGPELVALLHRLRITPAKG